MLAAFLFFIVYSIAVASHILVTGFAGHDSYLKWRAMGFAILPAVLAFYMLPTVVESNLLGGLIACVLTVVEYLFVRMLSQRGII